MVIGVGVDAYEEAFRGDHYGSDSSHHDLDEEEALVQSCKKQLKLSDDFAFSINPVYIPSDNVLLTHAGNIRDDVTYVRSLKQMDTPTIRKIAAELIKEKQNG